MAIEGAYRHLVVRLAAEACGPGESLGVEVGVAKGKTSEMLLRSLPDMTLMMVDPWRGDRAADDSYVLSRDTMAKATQTEMDAMHEECLRRVAFAGERARVLRTSSWHAYHEIECGSASFVFLDPEHTRNSCWRDSVYYWSKLREGGRMIWHDCGNPTYPGVAEAVCRFCEMMDLRLEQEEYFVAWAEK